MPLHPTPYSLFPLIIIAILWGWAFWKWPVKTFALLPFVLPFYLIRTKIGPLPTTLLELIVIATVVVWILKEIRDQRLEIGSTRISDLQSLISSWILPIGLWLLAGLIGIFVAQNHVAALGLYRAYFVEPVLIFIIGLDLMRGRTTREDVRFSEGTPEACPYGLLTSFAVVLIILGLYAAVQYVTGWGIPYPWHDIAGRRAVGPFPYPNALSLFVVPIVVLAFADRLRPKAERMISSWLGWGAITGGILAIILAKSDGGLIAAFAGMFIASLFYKRMRIIAIGMAAIVLLAIGSIGPLRDKAIEVVTFKEWSGMVRTVMWKESVTMLKDRPIFGAGLGGYPDAIKPYHKATWMEIFQYPHNIALNLWSETGLLGVVAFGWILITWAQGAGRRAQDETHALRTTHYALAFPVITAIVVHGLVDVPYFKNDLAIAFWLLILITVIYDRPSFNNTRENT